MVCNCFWSLPLEVNPWATITWCPAFRRRLRIVALDEASPVLRMRLCGSVKFALRLSGGWGSPAAGTKSCTDGGNSHLGPHPSYEIACS